MLPDSENELQDLIEERWGQWDYVSEVHTRVNLSSRGLQEWIRENHERTSIMTHEIDVLAVVGDEILAVETKYFDENDTIRYHEGIGQALGLLFTGVDRVALQHHFHESFDDYILNTVGYRNNALRHDFKNPYEYEIYEITNGNDEVQDEPDICPQLRRVNPPRPGEAGLGELDDPDWPFSMGHTYEAIRYTPEFSQRNPYLYMDNPRETALRAREFLIDTLDLDIPE